MMTQTGLWLPLESLVPCRYLRAVSKPFSTQSGVSEAYMEIQTTLLKGNSKVRNYCSHWSTKQQTLTADTPNSCRAQHRKISSSTSAKMKLCSNQKPAFLSRINKAWSPELRVISIFTGHQTATQLRSSPNQRDKWGRQTDRGIFHPLVHSPDAGPGWGQVLHLKPPTWVQGLKHLGRPPLPSQAAGTWTMLTEDPGVAAKT